MSDSTTAATTSDSSESSSASAVPATTTITASEPAPSTTTAEAPRPSAHKRPKLRPALPRQLPPPVKRQNISQSPAPIAKRPPDFISHLNQEPDIPSFNPFNVSEIIKGFLYIGAGFDANGRMVTTLPDNHPELAMDRAQWWSENQVRFALNMASNPLQIEIKGITYPETVQALSLDVNDVPEWQGEDMRVQFDLGAGFIQEAHDKFIQNNDSGGIFVHCVAGVNRSPFVVVWWLVKFHNVHPNYAFDLVRIRRDRAVGWHEETLGGSLFAASHLALEKPAERSRRKWFEELLRTRGGGGG